MRKRTFGVIMGALLVMLLAAPATGQTLGNKFSSSSTDEVWSIVIAISDSISTYVALTGSVETVHLYVPTITAGGVAFESSVDTAPGSSVTLATFLPVMTTGAVLDSVATGTGGWMIDITSKVKAAQFFRVHVGYNSTVVQAAARTFYVFIKKRR